MKQNIFQPGFLLALLLHFLFQWEGSQINAWVNMIQEYSKESSLTQAVEETFSGNKPCSMCIQLTQSRTETEADSEFAVSPGIEQYLSPPESFDLCMPDASQEVMYPAFSPGKTSITHRPPTPPPRFFFS